jgi:hypothetical protein
MSDKARALSPGLFHNGALPVEKKTRTLVMVGILAVLALVAIYVYVIREPAGPPVNDPAVTKAQELAEKMRQNPKNQQPDVPLEPSQVGKGRVPSQAP